MKSRTAASAHEGFVAQSPALKTLGGTLIQELNQDTESISEVREWLREEDRVEGGKFDSFGMPNIMLKDLERYERGGGSGGRDSSYEFFYYVTRNTEGRITGLCSFRYNEMFAQIGDVDVYVSRNARGNPIGIPTFTGSTLFDLAEEKGTELQRAGRPVESIHCRTNKVNRRVNKSLENAGYTGFSRGDIIHWRKNLTQQKRVTPQ